MFNEEEFKKIINEQRRKYFSKYFLQNNINVALYTATRDAIIKLTTAYLNFALLNDSVNFISNDKLLWKKLSTDTQNQITDIKPGIKEVSRNIENILIAIVDGFASK